MTWESKELGTARRSYQDRFRIYFEQMDLFSEEAKDFWNDEVDELEEQLTFKQGFAKELLSCMEDHLSIADLKQIVEVFGARYEEREAKRLEFVSKLKEKYKDFDVLIQELKDEHTNNHTVR